MATKTVTKVSPGIVEAFNNTDNDYVPLNDPRRNESIEDKLARFNKEDEERRAKIAEEKARPAVDLTGRKGYGTSVNVPVEQNSLKDAKAAAMENLTQAIPDLARAESDYEKARKERDAYKETLSQKNHEAYETLDRSRQHRSDKIFNTTDPILQTFLEGFSKKQVLNDSNKDDPLAQLKVATDYKGTKIKPQLNRGIKKAIAGSDDYEALVAQGIYDRINDKENKTPDEEMFMAYWNKAMTSLKDDDTLKGLKQKVAEAKEAKKGANAAVKMGMDTIDKIEKALTKGDRKVKVEPGKNKIGIRVSGGGANASYILEVHRDPEDPEGYILKGYKAINNNSGEDDWLKSHSSTGASIGKGYKFKTPEERDKAIASWCTAVEGNLKQLEGYENKWSNEKSQLRDFDAGRQAGRSVFDYILDRAKGNITSHGFSNFETEGTGKGIPLTKAIKELIKDFGVQIDRNTFQIYGPDDKVPEGFEPITLTDSEALRHDRIKAQADKIMQGALAGNKGYELTVDDDGNEAYIKILKPENKYMSVTRGASRGKGHGGNTMIHNLNSKNKSSQKVLGNTTAGKDESKKGSRKSVTKVSPAMVEAIKKDVGAWL